MTSHEEDKKRSGRPAVAEPKKYYVQARLTKKEHDALNAVCASNDMTVSEVLVTALAIIGVVDLHARQ